MGDTAPGDGLMASAVLSSDFGSASFWDWEGYCSHVETVTKFRVTVGSKSGYVEIKVSCELLESMEDYGIKDVSRML